MFRTVLLLMLPAAALGAQAGEVVLVPRGALWRYLDTGQDAGTAWRGLQYDDSKWSLGPAELGYGDGDERTRVGYGPSPGNKYVTTYFRHTFTVTPSTLWRALRLRILRDDGAVVYLNGVEVFRTNLPAGPIGYRTLARNTVAGTAETRFHEAALRPTLLRAGKNVLAVEVHQASPRSSDLSFDLELLATDGGPRVVRGPYLQSLSATGVVLRWRTDVATDSVVWYGPAPNRLTSLRRVAGLRTEHAVPLTGLQPATRYYYGVGRTGDLRLGGDSRFTFRTAPPTGTASSLRIWVLGDSGTATADAAAVREGFRRFAAGRDPDVWLLLGDNAYWRGTDAEYQAALFDMYPRFLRRVPLWPTFGNHDGLSARSPTQSGVYYDIFTLPKGGEAGGIPSGTEAYYAFDYGNVHFVCLDSHDSPRSTTGAMLQWLKKDLAATRATWVIVFFHHPPYTKGSHDSDNCSDSGGRMCDMRANALPLLEAGGVDLVLAGHSHSYERSMLLDGHYGFSWTLKPTMILDPGDGDPNRDGPYVKPNLRGSHEGAVYVVAGSSGKTGGGPLNHPVMHRSLNLLGSLVLDVAGPRLTARFLDIQGQVRDTFTILKGVRRTLLRDRPRIPVATGGTQRWTLRAGAAHAGRPYVLAGSFSTQPGFTLGPVHVPLNPDPWFILSLVWANTSVFQNTAGRLDAQGTAQAALSLPPLPPVFRGLRLYHAYLVYDSTGPRMASNVVSLELE